MQKIRLFIADDNDDVRRTIARIFKREERFEILTESGENGLDDVVKKITLFKPHVLIVDMVFDFGGSVKSFNGIDILEKCVKEKMIKYVLSGMGDSNVATKATNLGAICFSKPVKLQLLLHDQEKGIYANLNRLSNSIKKRKLNQLLHLAKIERLTGVWYDQTDIQKEKSGSEVIYINFGKYRSVRAISLFLWHKKPNHGTCLSISFGCIKNCRICKSGTEEKYRGNFSSSQIIAMQEAVMRNSYYFNEVFWLDALPFFVAVMGAGDINFNFRNTISAMECIKMVFKDRFICNVSTAFQEGVDKLLKYADNSKALLVPNLQISLHGGTINTRREHVDSLDDPIQFLLKGIEYAEKTKTRLTVNYGLTTENCNFSEIQTVLEKMNPECSRIKFSKMTLPEKSGLKPVKKERFDEVKRMAENLSVECEIFDENYQMGVATGASCGNIINKIVNHDNS